MSTVLLYTAISMAISAALVLAAATLFRMTGNPKAERNCGAVSLLMLLVSFPIYYYYRIIVSGGRLADPMVFFVVLSYAVTAALGALAVISGSKKDK